jgi:hypothetical protein
MGTRTNSTHLVSLITTKVISVTDERRKGQDSGKKGYLIA